MVEFPYNLEFITPLNVHHLEDELFLTTFQIFQRKDNISTLVCSTTIYLYFNFLTYIIVIEISIGYTCV